MTEGIDTGSKKVRGRETHVVRVLKKHERLILGLSGLALFGVIWQILAITVHNKYLLTSTTTSLVAMYQLAFQCTGHYCLTFNLYQSAY